jgi:hypothetical protein
LAAYCAKASLKMVCKGLVFVELELTLVPALRREDRLLLRESLEDDEP